MLYIFSGLPAVGKTTLSRRLAQQVTGLHLRIDTIEQALRDICGLKIEGEGYRVAYRIAADNLLLGIDVVADSCNPIELTRREWQEVASDSGAAWINIEVICSDATEHRRRIESRASDLPGLVLPTWEEVCSREYSTWTEERVVIDTAGKSSDDGFDELLRLLECRH